MEINKDNIEEVLKTDEFKNDLLPLFTKSETIESLISKRADATYKEKIDEEVKNIHSQYDNDIFSILGERPGQKDDGSKEKTYEFVKRIAGRLKDLEGIKDSLNKDAEVARLNGVIEDMKANGDGARIQKLFDDAKSQWTDERSNLLQKIEAGQKSQTDFQKTLAIDSAINNLKFDPNLSESVKNMILKNVKADLIKNSKFEEGKLYFLTEDGKTAMNKTTWEAMTASEVLESMEAIKDITVKDGSQKGGGADVTIKGSLKITSVEGKNTKSLILPEGLITTKVKFDEEVTKTLIASGIERGSNEWKELRSKAYKEYNVAKLPRV